MKKDIYVLGIGNNTPVIMELAELNGYNLKGLYNYTLDGIESTFLGIPVLGTYDDLFENPLDNLRFCLSMGDNKIRKNLFKKLLGSGAIIPSLFHPTASISKYAKISSKGVIVQANATIQATVEVDSNTVVSYNVGITHSTKVGKHCYIAGQTVIGAYTKINEGAFIGMGAVTISSKVPYIGEWSKIGAGSVVTRPVEKETVVFGNPAKAK